MASSFQSCACILASKPAGSLPLSLSYFAHRYSIFCELLLGTAVRLHAKGKTRLDSHDIKTGISIGENVSMNLVTIQERCKHNIWIFLFVKNIFRKKSFDELMKIY